MKSGDLERVVDEVVEVLHAVSATEVHAVVDHAAVALGVWRHGKRCESEADTRDDDALLNRPGVSEVSHSQC